jgi:hypothetical protein
MPIVSTLFPCFGNVEEPRGSPFVIVAVNTLDTVLERIHGSSISDVASSLTAASLSGTSDSALLIEQIGGNFVK